MRDMTSLKIHTDIIIIIVLFKEMEEMKRSSTEHSTVMTSSIP